MAINDYEADATELLETYGMLEVLLYFEPNSTISLLQRLPHEIHHHRWVRHIFAGICTRDSLLFL